MATTMMSGGGAGAGGGAWSYAVPLEETDGNARAYRAHSPQRTEQERDENAAKTLEKRSSAWDLQSDSETAKQRRTSVRANNSTAVRKRSRKTLRENKAQASGAAPTSPPSDASTPYTPGDDSAWIHRDKLAQIEIQEMEEAGIYIRPSRRSQSLGNARENGSTSRPISRSGSRKKQREQLNGYDEDYAAAYPGYEGHDHPHPASALASPRQGRSPERSTQRSRPQDHSNEDIDPHDMTEPYDEQPGNITNNPYSSQSPMGRPSTSRIPISRNAAVPVPNDVIERDSPLPRSRAGSQSLSGSWDNTQYARRAREGSVSSQVLLDADQDRRRVTPPEGALKQSSGDYSPQKARPPKQNPSGRKTPNTPTTTARPGSSAGKRVTSGSASRRPDSSSGHKSRHSNGHHTPEGDPPWIASMYKPDPRLPPDQQMLPTHAKRMMQEQWEREGKTGTIYDRDFNLLNDEDMRPKGVSSPVQYNSNDPDAGNRDALNHSSPIADFSPEFSTGSGWPLGSKGDSGSIRQGNGGGYKITPTIPDTPTMQRPLGSSSAPPRTSSTTQDHPPRALEISEKDEPKPSKACCCVVM